MTTELTTLATDLLARVPHKNLPKHVGKPTFSQIREIQKLIEENAGSVSCSIETGEYNHLFLTKTNTEYTELTGNEPVAMPVEPDRPEIANNATAARIAQANQTYIIAKKLYDKTKAMKELLMNQLTTSFEPKWTQSMRHTATRQLNHRTIPEIFTFLYTRYGNVQSDIVRAKENELLSTPVDLDLPIIILFDEIEDFRVLAQAAGVPRTSAQLLDMVLKILKGCGCFTPAVITWNNITAAEKTWANLKEHFDQAHQNLENALDLPIGQSSFQQANVLAQQVAASVGQDMQHQLQVLQQSVNQALQLAQQTQENSVPPASDYRHDMNNMTEDSTVLSDIKNHFQNQINIMKMEHKKEVDSLRQQVQQVKQNSGNSGRQNNKRNNDQRKGGDADENEEKKKYWEGPRFRTDISKYCWTHGACNHTSAECGRKAPKHKSNATFQNKMNGNMAFCQYVNE